MMSSTDAPPSDASSAAPSNDTPPSDASTAASSSAAPSNDAPQTPPRERAGAGKFQAQLPVYTPTTFRSFFLQSAWQTRRLRLVEGKLEVVVAAAASSKPLRALLIGGGYAAAKATDRPFAVEASGVSFETGEADSVIFSCSSEQERQDWLTVLRLACKSHLGRAPPPSRRRPARPPPRDPSAAPRPAPGRAPATTGTRPPATRPPPRAATPPPPLDCSRATTRAARGATPANSSRGTCRAPSSSRRGGSGSSRPRRPPPTWPRRRSPLGRAHRRTRENR